MENLFQDLTAPITPETTVYPGDPTFHVEAVTEVGKDSHFGLSVMTMNNHMGTHIDFPAHVKQNGKTSSDYDLNDLMGSGLVIQVPKHYKYITKDFIERQTILDGDFVIFKTTNSDISKQGELCENYVYIELEAAQALVEKRVAMVGIDYMSVDNLQSDELPVHNLLLRNDILIVENLALKEALPGRGQVFVAPLNIPNMDGLPARVFMSRSCVVS